MIQAAGPLLFWAPFGGPALAAPAAATDAGPAAAYYSTVHEARPGDAFEVSVTVRWSGDATAFDIPVPEPHAADGLHFRMLGAETEHDAGESRVRFRWQVLVDEPGRFALPDLLPVTAYPAASPSPIPVRTDLPATIEVATPARGVARLGRLALLGLALAMLAGGAIAWVRARRSSTSTAAGGGDLHAPDRLLGEIDAARAHRLSGGVVPYLDALVRVARSRDRPAAPSPVTDELLALRERIAYASYHPTPGELDALEEELRRMLTQPSTDTSHEEKEARS